MHMLTSTFLIALAALGCAGRPSPSGASASPAPAAGGPRVLFVGNSLTEGNALPAMVEALARAAGQPLAVEAVTFGGFSLEDHWNRGDARRAIARGGFRFVVLQQGPSSLADSRANLVEWTRRFGEEIRRAGARPALYSVWPESARASVFADVTRSYAEAAASVDGLLLPVGEAWRAAWRREPSLALYGSDGFHPTPRGTYLAALVIAARLLDRPPAGLAQDVGGAGVPAVRLGPAERALFEAAAAEAIASPAGS
ncbi:MAG: SGNH/GDSL hydrolase family protein [Vicinamibacteria bacterium]